jgi:hypothetical protein
MKDKIDFVDEMEREVALHLTVVMLLLPSVVVAFAWGDACLPG